MVIRNMKSGRRLAVIALFAILALSAFGFAASNTVDDTNAGDGTGDVSGGAATNVHYTVNLNGEVTGVTFDYNSTVTPGTVGVALLDINGDVIVGALCTGTHPSYSCTFATPQDIVPIEGLRVVTFS